MGLYRTPSMLPIGQSSLDEVARITVFITPRKISNLPNSLTGRRGEYVWVVGIHELGFAIKWKRLIYRVYYRFLKCLRNKLKNMD